MNSFSLEQTSSAKKRIKVMDTLSRVWKTQGLSGMFAGNGVNVLRIFPTSALVCLVYSRMIKVCDSLFCNSLCLATLQ